MNRSKIRYLRRVPISGRSSTATWRRSFAICMNRLRPLEEGIAMAWRTESAMTCASCDSIASCRATAEAKLHALLRLRWRGILPCWLTYINKHNLDIQFKNRIKVSQKRLSPKSFATYGAKPHL